MIGADNGGCSFGTRALAQCSLPSWLKMHPSASHEEQINNVSNVVVVNID